MRAENGWHGCLNLALGCSAGQVDFATPCPAVHGSNSTSPQGDAADFKFERIRLPLIADGRSCRNHPILVAATVRQRLPMVVWAAVNVAVNSS